MGWLGWFPFIIITNLVLKENNLKHLTLQDIGLAADLAKILRQAEQPVPDFLQGGGTATYRGNKYGGSDIRVSNIPCKLN